MGSRVVVRGLKSRPALNGTGGLCAAYVATKMRYAVKVDGVDDKLLLKAENLLREEDADAAADLPAVD